MEKDFDKWNNVKKNIDLLDKAPNFNEGEIWFCNLGLNVGYEEDGKGENFLRPVVIIRKFNKSVFYGIPLTSKIKDSEFYFQIKHKGKVTGSAILSQMKLIDSKRLNYRIGRLDNDDFKELKEKLRELIL